MSAWKYIYLAHVIYALGVCYIYVTKNVSVEFVCHGGGLYSREASGESILYNSRLIPALSNSVLSVGHVNLFLPYEVE